VARLQPEPHDSAPQAAEPQEIKARSGVAETVVEIKPRAKPPVAVDELFEALHAIRQAGGTRSLVLAPASGCEDADHWASQLALLTREQGLRVAAFQVGDSGSTAPRRRGTHSEVRFAVSRADLAAQVESWRAALPSDTVALLIAPPLAHANDAALLARACDGLLILVELGRTPRRALTQAVKRATTAGAAVLGLVVIGSDNLPRWARRFLQNESIEV
jgi:hypothetical protein